MVAPSTSYKNGNSGMSTAATPARQTEAKSSPEPLKDLTAYLKEYAQREPEMAALWCVGVGFVLGWKLRGW